MPTMKMGRPPKVTPNDKIEIVSRVSAGETKLAVAQDLNLSRMHVWRILKKHAPHLLQKRSARGGA